MKYSKTKVKNSKVGFSLVVLRFFYTCKHIPKMMLPSAAVMYQFQKQKNCMTLKIKVKVIDDLNKMLCLNVSWRLANAHQKWCFKVQPFQSNGKEFHKFNHEIKGWRCSRFGWNLLGKLYFVNLHKYTKTGTSRSSHLFSATFRVGWQFITDTYIWADTAIRSFNSAVSV